MRAGLSKFCAQGNGKKKLTMCCTGCAIEFSSGNAELLVIQKAELEMD